MSRTAKVARRRARQAWRHYGLTGKRRKQLRLRARRLADRRRRHTYERTIFGLPSREEIPELLNRRGLTGTAAEIGVKTGKFSDQILSDWRGRKLISIDPWLEAEPDEYVDRANVEQDQHERFYRETCERLARHGERSEIWRMTSLEGAAKIEDGSLDFVYIDARHDYDSVKEDLEAWFGKVRPGGILAGHDYVDGMFPSGEFGVKSAVDEFFAEKRIPVHGTPWHQKLFPSWVVEIPREPR